MFTDNSLLAMAIQKDHLRAAHSSRLSRQLQAVRKALTGKKAATKEGKS